MTKAEREAHDRAKKREILRFLKDKGEWWNAQVARAVGLKREKTQSLLYELLNEGKVKQRQDPERMRLRFLWSITDQGRADLEADGG